MSDRLACVALGESGTADAVPVIFLHGFGGLAEQWGPLQRRIARHAPTLAFDMPGHGGSLNYSGFGPPKVAARAVVVEMEQRGIAKAHFVGHSMGGAISSLVALFAPEKVASLTLLAPGGFGPEINHPLLVKWAKAKTHDEFSALMPQFFAPGFDIPADQIDMNVEARKRPGVGEALLRISSEIANDGKQGTLPLADILGKDFPVSLIWGTEDGIIPVSHVEAQRDRVDLHIVEGMGHMPAEEAPELVEKVVVWRINQTE